MSLQKKKQQFKNQYHFLPKKPVLFQRYLKPSLKHFLVKPFFSNQRLFLYAALLGPVFFCVNLGQSWGGSFQKFFPLLNQTLPGSFLPTQTLSWETFQKTQSLPIYHQYDPFQKANLLELQLFKNTITKIHYWSDLLTFQLTKQWECYKKNYFFGIKPDLRDQTQTRIKTPLVFSARDNSQSRFYSCVTITDQKINVGPTTSQFNQRFYQLDEFPLKLQTISENSQFTEFKLPDLLENQDRFNLLKKRNEQKESKKQVLVNTDEACLLTEWQWGNLEKANQTQNQSYPFIGIQMKLAKVSETKNQSSKLTLVLNQDQLKVQTNQIRSWFKNHFYKMGTSPNYLRKTIESNSDILMNPKWKSVASHQFLGIIQDQLLVRNDEIQLRSKVGNLTSPSRLTDSYQTQVKHFGDLVEKWQPIYAPRQMSGFVYPDMQKKGLMDYDKQSQYSRNITEFLATKTQLPFFQWLSEVSFQNQIRIFLGEHFSHPSIYDPSKPKPLRLNVNFYSVIFEDGRQPKYVGPGVLPISEKELSQKPISFSLESALAPQGETKSTSLAMAIYSKITGKVIYKTPSAINNQSEFTQSKSPTNLNLSNSFSLALDSKNWFDVKSNLTTLLDKNDPHQETKKAFFHQKSDSKAPSLIQKHETSFTFIEAQRTQFIALGNYPSVKMKHKTAERNPEIVSPNRRYLSKLVVPFLPNEAWQDWFTNPSRDKFAIDSFPIRRLSSLRHEHLDNTFDLLDYQFPINSVDFLTRTTGKDISLISYDQATAQSAFIGNLIRKNLTNISYLSNPNPVQLELASLNQSNTAESNLPFNLVSQIEKSLKADTSKKYQLWEPLHENSWLVVIQYILALFIFFILRQFTASYGKELIAYLIDVISALGILDSSFKDELTSDESKYRLIQEPKTRFKNIAGIEPIFSQLSEIVWFLRTSRSSQNVGQKSPKGLLLIGPPGSGKTLLVQAIAGEAQVPIFLQPAGTFTNLEGLGAQRLQRLFEKAQEVAPCLIFFDEIDSIGQRRSHIIQTVAGSETLFDLVSNSVKSTKLSQNQNNESAIPFNGVEGSNSSPNFSTLNNRNQANPSQELIETELSFDSAGQSDPEKLSLLMQLLIELDGLQSKKKVIVIGATNRIDVLDPALIRPGRFDKVLKLGLPKKEKRIQICQLYAKVLGLESSIYWEYIGNKTLGLSGADLAAIMNQSSIDAILQGTKHTMQTIEIAIDKIVGDNSQAGLKTYLNSLMELDQSLGTLTTRAIKPSSSFIPLARASHSESFIISRFAYYNTGMAFLNCLLPQLETPISCSLIPTRANSRYEKNQKQFSRIELNRLTKDQLKAQITALFGGKLCEFLYFKKGISSPNFNFSHSDLGGLDLWKATNSIYQYIDHWYLDSTSLCLAKKTNFSTNQNSIEIKEPKVAQFLASVAENCETSYKQQLTPKTTSNYYHFQHWAGKSNWQIQVTQERNGNNGDANWYRIYLKNPDEVVGNEEWVVPDLYYHKNQAFFLTKTVGLSDLIATQRDFLYQKLIHAFVNDALNLFTKNTELIDFFASSLVQNKDLRRFEIEAIFAQFNQKVR